MKLSYKRTVSNLLKDQLTHRSLHWIFPLLWVGGISGLAFFWNLGNIGLVDETEPLFAEAARQMLVRGDWITPYFNDAPRFDKPPLIYWFMAISYQRFGVNEWAVRLPSALAATILMGLGFYTLRFYVQKSREKLQRTSSQRLQDIHTLFHPLPWIGSALFALNPETIAWARTGVSDMLLTSCMGCALLSFFLGYSTAGEPSHSCRIKLTVPGLKKYSYRKKIEFKISSFWYFIFYVFMGLSVLTKGPVGLVLTSLIIGAFLLYLGNFKQVLQEMRLILGGLLFCILTLPWYILVTLQNGRVYLDTFFGYHNFERFTQVVNHHSAPWYFYFIVILIGFAPGSIYLPLAITQVKFWKRRIWQHQPRYAQLKLFALFWFSSVFIFFTIATTKLPSYVLPLMPASAILVSFYWSQSFSQSGQFINLNFLENLSEKKQSNWMINKNIIYYINSIFLAMIALAILSSPRFIGIDSDMPDFRDKLVESGLLKIGALIWLLSSITIFFCIKNTKIKWILVVNLIGFIACFIFVVSPIFNLIDDLRQEPLRNIAKAVYYARKPAEELIMIGFKKPSLVFYTQNSVQYYQTSSEVLQTLKNPKFQAIQYPTVLIVAHPDQFKGLHLQPNHYQILNQQGTYQLIRVPKSIFLAPPINGTP